MRAVTTIRAMQVFADAERSFGRRIGFVPTMGALHEGHLSLVREARRRADTVVASIFVNPMQFNSRSDFESYPRDEARDAELLRSAGADVLFQPTPSDMYPDGFDVRLEVTELAKPLCGAHRPGHFAGVTTVVAKLFLAVKPHVAVFGAKDYQQLQVVRRMTRDLNFDVEIVAGETVREADGLAMSSRNRRLSPADRERARAIPAAIAAAKRAAAGGERDSRMLEALVRRGIESADGARVEYVDIRDAETLEALDILDRPAVLAVAAWISGVRLIDNIILEAGEPTLAALEGTLS